MNYKIIVNEEILQGPPVYLESALKVELANELLKMGANNYENVCYNMRILADVFEEIEEHINDNSITFKYNPMGSWYRVEEDEESKNEFLGE